MFQRVPVPTPFQVGPVNAYLAGRTVVDPGPDSEDALAALTDGLAERDLGLGDVEQVLVTHAHPDHFGLANHLRERGAEILASPTAAGILRDFEGRLEYEQSYFVALFEAHGMAPETTRTVTQLPAAFVEYAPSTAVDRELTEGETVAVDGTELAVRELVGHSESELAFEWRESGGRDDGGERDTGERDGDESDSDGSNGDESDRDESDAVRAADVFAAIVGDHVLPDTTPNPFLQPPPREDATTAMPAYDGPADLDDQRPRQLPAFNESLRELRTVGHDRLLPGHGEPVADPQGRIDEILAAHEERSEAVLEIVDGPTAAIDVMRGLFEDLPVIDYFPAMSEALGHLDVLVERGEVVREERDGELVYLPV